jgi:phenylacetate-CoA ligase
MLRRPAVGNEYMKLFDWSLRLNGLPIHQTMPVFEQLLAMDAVQLTAYQWQQRQALLAFHQAYTPFYQQWLQQHGLDPQQVHDWHKLPVVTKQALQGHLEDHLSLPYRKAPLFKNSTSGSSGIPFHFAKDKWCHAMTWASFKYRFGQHGIDFNKSWQARFYGIPLSGKKYYKEKIKDYFSHRVRFPVFNLNDATCAQYLERFRHYPFQYLNGYTSSLVLFASYCIRQSIVLKDICPTLTHCFPTSEVCSEMDREVLKQGFGVPVVNEYGAAELDLLAVENPAGEWVLNEETLFIEILDDENQPVPDGTVGKVVVTALYNKAMPLIRYELGDRAAIVPGKLANGRRLLQHMEGRTNDIAVLPSGRKVPGLTFYYVTKSLLSKGSNIREFVIRQTAPADFVLEYVAEEVLTPEQQQQVKMLMDEYLEPGLGVHFQKVDQVNRTRVGKLRQFQSEVKLA